MTISAFVGEYEFLSNFYPCTITYEGQTYPSVEHAYQAAKTLDLEKRSLIALAPTAALAKKMGRNLRLRSDWDDYKLVVMAYLLGQKFSDPVLKTKLMETGTQKLVEGNWWGDQFWGVSNGFGHNHLGLLLQNIRDFFILVDSGEF